MQKWRYAYKDHSPKVNVASLAPAKANGSSTLPNFLKEQHRGYNIEFYIV
jgi:hypothetical protein